MENLFNLQTTAMHTDAERAAMVRNVLAGQMDTLRAQALKRAAQTFTMLRTRRDFARDRLQLLDANADTLKANAELLAACGFDDADAERAAHAKDAEMYARAAALFGDEMLLFLLDLRNEIAETLLTEFGEDARELADTLRKG